MIRISHVLLFSLSQSQVFPLLPQGPPRQPTASSAVQVLWLAKGSFSGTSFHQQSLTCCSAMGMESTLHQLLQTRNPPKLLRLLWRVAWAKLSLTLPGKPLSAHTMFLGKALGIDAHLGMGHLVSPTTRAGYSKFPRECSKPFNHYDTEGKGRGK